MKRIAGVVRRRNALARAVCLIVFVAGGLGWTASPAYGIERQWTGSGGNNEFSNPDNWSPVGTPQAHDELVFPAGTDAHNDMVARLIIDTIRFTGSGTAHVSGYPISVFNWIKCQLTSGLAQLDLDIAVGEVFYFHVNAGVTLNVGGRVDAYLFGPNVGMRGPGTLILSATNQFASFDISGGVVMPMSAHALGGGTFTNVTVGGGTLHLVVPIPNGLMISGYGSFGTNGALTIAANASVTLTNSIKLFGLASIYVPAGANLAIDSVIHGNGSLTKTGPGNLYLGGMSGGVGNNTYSGDTTVAAGTLYLSKNQNVLSVPGQLVVGPGTAALPAAARFSRSGTMPSAGTATVNANSLLDLNGYNQTLAQLNLNDGGDVQTGAGQLNFAAGGGVNVGTLNVPQVGLLASSSITGKIGLPVMDYLTFNVGGYGPAPLVPDAELVVPAIISGGGNIIKDGAGTMQLSGANTFNDSPPNLAGDLYIYDGTVIAANNSALGGTAGWTLVYNGARLALVDNVTVNNETLYLNTTNITGLDNPGGNNVWTGTITLARDSSIGVNLDWSLTVAGTVSGTGSLTKRGDGLLRLGGSANNTYSGNTFVDAGTLSLTKFPNIQAVPANLIIGRPEGGTSATVIHVNSDLIWGDVTVNNGGLLNINGYTEYIGTLTLNGGGDVQTGAGTLHLLTSLSVNPGSFADQSVISGRLGLNPGTLQFSVGPGSLASGVADCLVSAIIGQTSTTAGLQKNDTGILQLTGNNTYTGSTILAGGTLWVDGSQPQSPVQVNGNTLFKGSGTVGQLTLSGSLSSIAPGSSPGTLTCSNFTATALGSNSLQIELNGPTPGSSHDQVNVRGTVNLSGLGLDGSLGFLPPIGLQMTIVNNDGADAVIGTFTGLAQNAKLYIGQELFQISYIGGTGNDVVLTRLITPPPPVLTIKYVPPASVRLVWATNDPPFSLESTTNLNQTNWITATPLPVVLSTNNVVTNALSGGQKYYRLVKP